MRLQHIKALVIERRHQLGIGRLAVRAIHGEYPLLLLSWLQTITEGCPFQLQLLIGQGALNMRLVRIAMPVLHPGEGQQQAVAVFLLVGDLHVQQAVALIAGASLNDLVTCEDTIDNVYILIGGAYLHGNGLAIAREYRA